MERSDLELVLAIRDHLQAELQEHKAEPTGLIRLAATFGFGRLWLGPALARFQERYPRIDLQLQLTEQLPDLAGEGFDGALWLWQVEGRQAAQWVSRRLARNQRILVASPDYLRQHGAPLTLQALQDHACLIVRENGPAAGQRFDLWTLHKHLEPLPTRVRVHGPLSSNSGELVPGWARHHAAQPVGYCASAGVRPAGAGAAGLRHARCRHSLAGALPHRLAPAHPSAD